MNVPNGPNPLRVAWSILRARRRRHPEPAGSAAVDHSALTPILGTLQQDGIGALIDLRTDIVEYRDHLAGVDPDALTRRSALAFWLNLYNAGALHVAAEAAARAEVSVLRVPGAFERAWVRVGGEDLSLDDIEHGKIRRFGDPRIHGALVCGSASCPTLRYEPYRGEGIGDQLDDQMRSFLTGGGAVTDRTSATLALSRVFLWYGGDFTRVRRMPTWLPARSRHLVRALRPWFDGRLVDWLDEEHPRVGYQRYDWSLSCRIGP
jgi:hypothetical protein